VFLQRAPGRFCAMFDATDRRVPSGEPLVEAFPAAIGGTRCSQDCQTPRAGVGDPAAAGVELRGRAPAGGARVMPTERHRRKPLMEHGSREGSFSVPFGDSFSGLTR